MSLDQYRVEKIKEASELHKNPYREGASSVDSESKDTEITILVNGEEIKTFKNVSPTDLIKIKKLIDELTPVEMFRFEY